MSVLVVAEAGVNHNGDLGLAEALISAAATAKADLIKFQTFVADRLVTRQTPLAAYQIVTGESDHYEMIRRLELSRTDHEHLISCCREAGIGFFSTAFDIESADLLVELGQRRFKIPSGEIDNLPLLRHLGSFGYEVILSTGMADMSEIAAALQALEIAGTSRDRVTVLHCTTEYPAPISEVNLRAMETIRQELDVAVGYSDHTEGLEVPVAAVALGASVIEKHLTLDRTLPGPDHRASLEPDEFALMVSMIRNVEIAMGNKEKRPTPSERVNREVVRRSIVAGRALREGELLDEAALAVKRPASGISPMHWDQIIGTRARRPYAKDEPIDL